MVMPPPVPFTLTAAANVLVPEFVTLRPLEEVLVLVTVPFSRVVPVPLMTTPLVPVFTVLPTVAVPPFILMVKVKLLGASS